MRYSCQSEFDRSGGIEVVDVSERPPSRETTNRKDARPEPTQHWRNDMDLFGKKARARVEQLEGQLRIVDDKALTLEKKLAESRVQYTDLSKVSDDLKEQKDLAVKRVFSAEDLLREFVNVSIASKDLRQKARDFLNG